MTAEPQTPETATESPRPRRRRAPSRRTRETPVAAEAKRPRRRAARRAAAEPRRPRRRTRMQEAPRPRRRASGYVMAPSHDEGAEVGLTVVTGGMGFIFADAVDRFLATYEPSAATKPTDRFTSDGAGTLANTLNVSATPNLYRVGWALASTLLPAVGSAYVQQPLVRSGLEGMAVGAGVSAFKLLWQSVIVPMLKPADTSTAGLQKSIIARLYPAEIAAAINLAQKQTASQGTAFGALSQPQLGVGASDVGPFALAGSSSYADAASALRHQAGFSGTSEYSDAADAIRRRAGVSGSSEYTDAASALRQRTGVQDQMYPDAGDALRRAAGVSQPYQPGPASTPGPQPHRADADCECGVGVANPFVGFLGDEENPDPSPLWTMSRVATKVSAAGGLHVHSRQ